MRKRTIIGLALLAIVAIPVVIVVLNLMGTAATVATAPGRVTQETFKTGNILSTYEGFFDTKAQYDSRTAQITERLGLIAGETNQEELRRLRMELSATRQSCRELANQYNADAQKNNDSLFLDRDLPIRLDVARCDATR